MAPLLTLAICAIAWAIASEIRITSLHKKLRRAASAATEFKHQAEQLERDCEKILRASSKDDAIARSEAAEMNRLRSENTSLRSTNEDILEKLGRAREERDRLDNKLKEVRQQYGVLVAEFEMQRRERDQMPANERRVREKLEEEIEARKKAVTAYFNLEARFRALTGEKQSVTIAEKAEQDRAPTQNVYPKSSSEPFPNLGASFAIIDVETTGFSATDEIVEIAIIEVDKDGKELASLETTLRCTTESNPYALARHRLERQALQNSPNFSDVSHAVANFINGKILIAHNLSFDLRMLGQEFKRVANLTVDLGKGIDTLYGGPDGQKTKLEKLIEEHGLDFVAHSAMADVRALHSLILSGAIILRVSGQETAVRANGLIRAGDCELKPRHLLAANPSAKNNDTDILVIPDSEFKDGPAITLHAGDKVCCSCDSRNSSYRPMLYKKHGELQLESVKHMSATHKCIVLESLSSDSSKALYARRLGVPLVRAEDFLQYEIGQSLRTWLPKTST